MSLFTSSSLPATPHLIRAVSPTTPCHPSLLWKERTRADISAVMASTVPFSHSFVSINEAHVTRVHHLRKNYCIRSYWINGA